MLADLAQAAILAASLLFVGAVACGLSTGWERLSVRFADLGCTCTKGKVCAKCLSESEAIRTK